jgi:pseudouridine-5'-phosphate glycosidase
VPGFYARSTGIAAPDSVADVDDAADLVAVHLGLGLGAGILVCVPVPEAEALPGDLAHDAVERAIREATEAGIGGPELTPWLLARIAVLTDGASVRANTTLIVNDAAFAGALAVRLAAR